MSALLYLHLATPAPATPAPPMHAHEPPPAPIFGNPELAAACVRKLGRCRSEEVAAQMLVAPSTANLALTAAFKAGLVHRERVRYAYIYTPPKNTAAPKRWR